MTILLPQAIGNTKLAVQVSPTPELLASNQSPLSKVLIEAGTAMAVLLDELSLSSSNGASAIYQTSSDNPAQV